MFKVNTKKCVGCGTCAAVCPNGIKLRDDYKPEILDQDEIQKCGGKEICPLGAIEEADQE